MKGLGKGSGTFLMRLIVTPSNHRAECPGHGSCPDLCCGMSDSVSALTCFARALGLGVQQLLHSFLPGRQGQKFQVEMKLVPWHA